MLTATYSLVALVTEQDKARGLLTKAQQSVRNAWQNMQNLEVLETTIGKLMHFDKFCRARKIEIYLIPALQRTTQEADVLIADLEELSVTGASLLRMARSRLTEDAGRGSACRLNEVWHAMSQYCDHLDARLAKEEKELLPLAHRVFSVEDWFELAAQFLAHDDNSACDHNPRHHHVPQARVVGNKVRYSMY